MVVLLATAGYDQTIRFWDAEKGVAYRTLQHPERQVNALQISPDKQYIAAGGNPSIKLYDVHAKGSDPLVTYDGHTASVTALGFQRDGRWMYSSSEDGTLKIWDLRAPGHQRDYECRAGVSSVCLHANQGELVAGDYAGCLRVFDLTANRCSAELAPEGDTPISSVTLAADASLVVAANYNGNAYFWAPANGASAEELTPIRKLQAHRSYVLSARLSPDVRLLATASADRTVKLWNTSDGSLYTTLAGHARWVWDCVFSADSSYLVSASSDMSAKLWDLSSSVPLRTYGGHAKAVTAVALNDAAPVPSPGAGGGGPGAAVVAAVGTGGGRSTSTSSRRGGNGEGSDILGVAAAAAAAQHAAAAAAAAGATADAPAAGGGGGTGDGTAAGAGRRPSGSAKRSSTAAAAVAPAAEAAQPAAAAAGGGGAPLASDRER